jgi:hypothetical protein
MLAIRHLNNEKGVAIVEMIPVMIVIVLLLSFSFGFFGVVHTGILNSIAARNYAFETFNHRADIRYFRSTVAPTAVSYYGKQGYRVHAIVSETRPDGDNTPIVTGRPIIFGWSFARPELIAESSIQKHSEVFGIRDDGTRIDSDKDGVNPIWIQSSYGICLNKDCKGN